MSAILKALRKQQSPLLQERAPVASGLLPSRHSGGDKRAVVMLLLLMLTALALGTAVGVTVQHLLKSNQSSPHTQLVQRSVQHSLPPISQSTSQPTSQPTSQHTSQPSARLNWGEATAIPDVDLNWQVPSVASSDVAQPANATSVSAPQRAALQTLNRDAVSPELLARFEKAVAATASDDNEGQTNSVIPNLTELSSSFQQRVPKFAYNSHMYSSLTEQRWIKLNERVLHEGERWQGIEVVSIEPQRVVLDLHGELFSVEALTDWQ